MVWIVTEMLLMEAKITRDWVARCGLRGAGCGLRVAGLSIGDFRFKRPDDPHSGYELRVST